jgi:hypothetical protein
MPFHFIVNLTCTQLLAYLSEQPILVACQCSAVLYGKEMNANNLCMFKEKCSWMHHLVTEGKTTCSNCILKETFSVFFMVCCYLTKDGYDNQDKALVNDNTQMQMWTCEFKVCAVAATHPFWYLWHCRTSLFNKVIHDLYHGILLFFAVTNKWECNIYTSLSFEHQTMLTTEQHS